MTRHVKVLWVKTFDGNVETDPSDTLAKKVFDTINGKTLISASIATFGSHVTALLIYDD